MCDAACLLTVERVGTTVCKCDDVCLLIAIRVGLWCVSPCFPVDNGEDGTTVCMCDDVCLLTADMVGLRCLSVTMFAC